MSAPFFSLADALADAQGEATVGLSGATFADPATLGVPLAARAKGREMRVLRASDGAVARLLTLTDTDALLAGSV
jgi:hypothetical protein